VGRAMVFKRLGLAKRRRRRRCVFLARHKFSKVIVHY
jgi:hypothetical protein